MDAAKATLRPLQQDPQGALSDAQREWVRAWCLWRYEVAVGGPREHELRHAVSTLRRRLGPEATHAAWRALH